MDKMKTSILLLKLFQNHGGVLDTPQILGYLKELVRYGYLEQDGKDLRLTEKGIKYLEKGENTNEVQS